MGQVLPFRQSLVTLTCWARQGCGIVFAIPQTYKTTAKENDLTIFCPKGHRLSLGKSDNEKLREELQLEIKRKEWAQQDAKAAKRSAASFKGKVTALKNRVGNGVCPCCKRTFQQLARHMKAKHPNFATEEA